MAALAVQPQPLVPGFRGVYRLDFVKDVSYIAHADPSGGSQDSFKSRIRLAGMMIAPRRSRV